MKNTLVKQSLTALVAVGVLALTNNSTRAAELTGAVQGANQPIAAATVTLYAAGEGAPSQVAQTKTDANGKFGLNATRTPKASIFYLVAKGPKEGVALMSLLGPSLPKKVTVNELTTVASTFCAARFIRGEAISGNALGLRIAGGNVPNLVDPETGTWGKVLLDPINVTQTTTLANLNTLGSLIAASFTVASDDWRSRFFKAATRPAA